MNKIIEYSELFIVPMHSLYTVYLYTIYALNT